MEETTDGEEGGSSPLTFSLSTQEGHVPTDFSFRSAQRMGRLGSGWHHWLIFLAERMTLHQTFPPWMLTPLLSVF